MTVEIISELNWQEIYFARPTHTPVIEAKGVIQDLGVYPGHVVRGRLEQMTRF